MMEQIACIKQKAYRMREWSLRMTTEAGSGHPTSALSAADIVAVLFFHAMRYDPDNFDNPNNDRFILSKGHASPILYAVWKELGKLSEQDLLSYRTFDSILEGHPTMQFPYTEVATGALGLGLSIGAGEAFCAKLDTRSYKTFVLMGDSEISEGCIWEAAQIASFYCLNNLIGIIDCNRLGQSTPTMEALEGDEAQRFERMFAAFGWHTFIVDGHDVKALMDVTNKARAVPDKSVMIIACTKKGYGVDLFEDKEGFHGKALSHEQLNAALAQLKKRFPQDAPKELCPWKPLLPSDEVRHVVCDRDNMQKPQYQKGTMEATRKAYGQAVAMLGSVCQSVVALDAEVKNSTYAELFEKAHPDRFFQCFIAEQNMVAMGVGFHRRGKIPFISTFSSFLSRAHDQIRMAAIGRAALRLVGSHAGVSIGADGPSQMGLEDIAMMRAIPDSVVLYPADAVSTYKLVHAMGQYDQGITYLRTTRMATPILYDNDEQFPIGGCKVVKQSSHDDVACVIGAGVTLVEALKAYDALAKEGILISVIDLYSIKPLDHKTIRLTINNSGKRVVTAEDHYPQGGLGEAIASLMCNDDVQLIQLAVYHMPRSGKADELLAYEAIDAKAIEKAVRALCR